MKNEEKSTINQRLNMLVDRLEGGSKSNFAVKVGVAVQSIHDLIGGRQGMPSFKLLSGILESYPEVDANWLVVGRGQMLISSIATGDTGGQKLESLPQSASALLVKQIKQDIEAISMQLADTQRMLEIFKREDEKLAEKSYMIQARGKDNITEEDKEQYRQLAAQTATLRELGQPYKLQVQSYIQQLSEKQEEYISAIRLEARDAQNSLSAVYRVEGDSDATRQYGGLLSQRLNISIESAMTLVVAGQIRSVYIESEGYRITEQAVREFLGEA